MSFKTGDFSRFLELTNPHGFDQVKRMSVHNDIFLAFLAPFYFIYSGPETLLVIQTVATALGALAVYGISNIIFEKKSNVHLISLFFSFAYLMYPALQRANQFDFHAVVLATPLLLFMYYFYLRKKYTLSSLCALGALLTKEQVGLTIAFFGIFVAITAFKQIKNAVVQKKEFIFAGILAFVGIGWFVLSMAYIIPYFRQGVHFALSYYGDFGDTPKGILLGLFSNPPLVMHYVFREDTLEYLVAVLGPLGFLSLFSPVHLLIAAPEFAINILSQSGAMRNIYFHYTAVTTPFIFISTLYGFQFLLNKIRRIQQYTWFIIAIFITFTLLISAVSSPLPYSLGKEVHPIFWPAQERFEAFKWQKIVADNNIKVMASGNMGPIFASRRYFYNFSERYDLADYIVLSHDDVYNGYENFKSIPAYEKLIQDKRYKRVYIKGIFEVYQKI